MSDQIATEAEAEAEYGFRCWLAHDRGGEKFEGPFGGGFGCCLRRLYRFIAINDRFKPGVSETSCPCGGHYILQKNRTWRFECSTTERRPAER